MKVAGFLLLSGVVSSLSTDKVSPMKRRCEGARKIVKCQASLDESSCKQGLLDRNVSIMSNMMRNTPYFGICRPQEQADDKFMDGMGDLLERIDEDPFRRINSFDEGSDPTHRGLYRSLQESEQVIPYGIDMIKAPAFWDQYGTRGSGVTICMIDTGILSSHEDLTGADISGSNAFVAPFDEDAISHGTHLAGTMIAQDNNVGVVGVSPDASFFMVRVFNDLGEFVASDLIAALDTCEAAGANIIGAALGAPGESAAESEAIDTLRNNGILIVASAGNRADRGNAVEYPGGYEGAMTVTAVDQLSRIANFSSYNAALDLAAPGIGVLSTVSLSPTEYRELSGTSMAVPHVIGTAALLWSQFPDASVEEIRTAMEESARDLGPCGFDPLYGNGLVDVMAAANYLETGAIAPEAGSCVDVQITVRTDTTWVSDLTFVVTETENQNNIIYRDGPFTGRRFASTVSATQLPTGCYDLIVRDEEGNPYDWTTASVGSGRLSIAYDGTEVQISDDATLSAPIQFGTCTADTPSPTDTPSSSPTDAPSPIPSPSPTASPTSSPSVAPTPAPTSVLVTPVPGTPSPSTEGACANGDLLLELDFKTDRWSRTENYLYLFDDAAADDEFIWKVDRLGFEAFDRYNDTACLDPSACYKFSFFDTWGDGLLAGALRLTFDGSVALEILPGDRGEFLAEGVDATRVWMESFGPCAETETESEVSMNDTD